MFCHWTIFDSVIFLNWFELELKDTFDTQNKTKHYDKSDDLMFPIVNFPFISSNTAASPMYGVYISYIS